MNVSLVTDEWPPVIHGGAGIHAVELTQALRTAGVDVEVFASQDFQCSPMGQAVEVATETAPSKKALAAIAFGVHVAARMSARPPDVIHSHTWLANSAGNLARLATGRPHVVTAHSLEPSRPWKAHTCGGGEYAISTWIEQTSFARAARIIAVSHAIKKQLCEDYPEVTPDNVAVVHNGVDTGQWFPDLCVDGLDSLGIRPHVPTVAFLGRVTRQKGLPYLLQAALALPPDVQIVVCVGASFPQEKQAAAELFARLPRAVWVEGVYDRTLIRRILSHATVLVCPSMYEPLGIVNLESMACGTPVIGSRVGGIPETVVDGVTGWLVPVEVNREHGRPHDPDAFVQALAEVISSALADPGECRARGAAGREHTERSFSWELAARRTLEVYGAALA